MNITKQLREQQEAERLQCRIIVYSGWALSHQKSRSNRRGHQAEFHFTMWISRRKPQAAAYLRRVAMDGECRSFMTLEMSRDTAGGLVPIRRAISAWDKPESCRARRSSSSNLNSGSRRSYSALTSGSVNSFLVNSLWLNMEYLSLSLGQSGNCFLYLLAIIIDAVRHIL